MEKNILNIEKEIEELDGSVEDIRERMLNYHRESAETKELLNELYSLLGIERVDENSGELEFNLASLNTTIDGLIEGGHLGGANLSGVDVVVSVVAGVVASIIDIVLVGTPEIVKVYRGGENFDGSVLTKLIRKAGEDGPLKDLTEWLSDKCKVPYDVSALKDTVAPNNHRLRNFGHDPLIGLLFAVVDIILGTATVIDDSGHIKIIVRDKDYPEYQKWLAVVYYLGHLISDVCTARGLPIPGSILTQFFAKEGDEESLARVVERMYNDGYDLRHLASMSTPVAVKNLIVDAYLYFLSDETVNLVGSIAEREIKEQRVEAHKYRMRLCSDAVGCSGNVLKFFIPPTCGNITALNLPEWTSLIKNTIYELSYQLRDKSVEKAILNREIINDNWEKLLGV